MSKRVKNDILLISLIAFLFLIILIVWLCNRESGKVARVYYHDELVYELDLYKPQEVKIQGEISTMVICVEYGKVYVKESGCSNQICVHSGKKSMENETITCLPNYVYIVIVGDSNE